MIDTACLVSLYISVVLAQINFGQFSLRPTPNGGWGVELSQGANIFGFGGHRALGISGNPAGVGISGTDNVIIANERVGVDSGLGAGTNGVNLGSQLQFGNDPFPLHPGGQLGNFIANIGDFFARMISLPAQPPVVPSPDMSTRGGRPDLPPFPPPSHRIGTEGVNPDGFLPRPWLTEEEHIQPVEGESGPKSTNLRDDLFPTLLPFRSDESPHIISAIDAHDLSTLSPGKPRQLPGLIDISTPT
ncbi:hypothetical protein KIN20_032964 [Parelaphostrongylus tenuis]|uniref:Uncharacterized protein n=1 Tax=Parelaphostrongylus tenuis TaxID=148309 RepID=A0AAD5WHV6_PARTN|nr:hypothetical protein KIN20_032964 [Parelaphostrongylus tenuis]